MCSLPHLSWSDHSEGTALLQHASGSLAEWGPQDVELIALKCPLLFHPTGVKHTGGFHTSKIFLLFL